MKIFSTNGVGRIGYVRGGEKNYHLCITSCTKIHLRRVLGVNGEANYKPPQIKVAECLRHFGAKLSQMGSETANHKIKSWWLSKLKASAHQKASYILRENVYNALMQHRSVSSIEQSPESKWWRDKNGRSTWTDISQRYTNGLQSPECAQLYWPLRKWKSKPQLGTTINPLEWLKLKKIANIKCW